jgi:hypothetical protein
LGDKIDFFRLVYILFVINDYFFVLNFILFYINTLKLNQSPDWTTDSVLMRKSRSIETEKEEEFLEKMILKESSIDEEFPFSLISEQVSFKKLIFRLKT